MSVDVSVEVDEASILGLAFVKGVGRAYGTAGHLFSGVTPDGQRFSVPHAYQGVSTAELRIRPVRERNIRGLEGAPHARAALERALDEKGLKNVEVVVRLRSMIRANQDLGLRQADASSVLLALQAALESNFDRASFTRLSGSSFLDTPYERMSALRFETGRLQPLELLPRFAYAYLRPAKNTPRDGFVPSKVHEETLLLLENLDKVSIEDVAEMATRSSQVSHAADEHAYGQLLFEELNGILHAADVPLPLGVCLSATSHGACILYPCDDRGRQASTAASYALRKHMGPSHVNGVSTTHPPLS